MIDIMEKLEMKKTSSVEIRPLRLEKINLPIIGTSPLIMHAWSAKAKKEMLDKQMKRASTGREAKDPQKDFEESIYRTEDGMQAFPAVAFKSAAVDAAVAMELAKTNMRQSFHVDADMIMILGDDAVMREDMVKVGMGTADIRYRAMFNHWGAILPITFNPGMLSLEQLTNLFNAGGFGIGIGEWRPQRDGQFGRFEVATGAKIKQIEDWQATRIKAGRKLRKVA